MSHALGPTDTRMHWPAWKRALYILLIPGYIGQPWRYKRANVIRRISPHEALHYGLWPAHYVEVKLDWHRDCQTHYPSWHKERRGFVRISRRLFRQHFLFDVDVFCQHHRHYNGTHDVLLRIAR